MQRIEVLETPGVIEVVGNADGPWPIPSCQIETVRTMAESGADCEVRAGLVVGKRVRVCDGPLMGHVGVLETSSRTPRLVVSLAILGQSVSTEIDVALLEPED